MKGLTLVQGESLWASIYLFKCLYHIVLWELNDTIEVKGALQGKLQCVLVHQSS